MWSVQGVNQKHYMSMKRVPNCAEVQQYPASWKSSIVATGEHWCGHADRLHAQAEALQEESWVANYFRYWMVRSKVAEKRRQFVKDEEHSSGAAAAAGIDMCQETADENSRKYALSERQERQWTFARHEQGLMAVKMTMTTSRT
jgi:hypothetical protein